MNKIKLLLILSIFTIMSIFLSFSTDRKKTYVNLDYFKLQKSTDFKGKISIRNINDFRKENEGKGDRGFLGYINDYGARFLEIRTTEDKKIDKILQNLIIDALNITGFDCNTTSEEKDKYPVLDIDLKEFYCDGMGRFYGIYIAFDINLYASNSNKKLIKKEVNIFTGFGIYSGDYDFKKTDFIELYDNYKWSLNKILIESIVFFETDLFINSYNGDTIYTNFDIKYKKSNLTSIPQDINNKNQIRFLDLDKNNIRKIENLDNFKNLLFLNLQRNKINKIENLNNLKNLKILCLRFNNISKIENLDYLENLIYLDLSYCKIKKLENLDNLKNLKYIIIFPYKDSFETIEIKTIDENTYYFLKNNRILINNGMTIDEFVNTKNVQIVKSNKITYYKTDNPESIKKTEESKNKEEIKAVDEKLNIKEFKEDFDSTKVGKLPDDWYYNYDSNANAEVVDSKIIKPYTIPNCLKLYDNSEESAIKLHKDIGEHYYGQLKFYFLVQQNNVMFIYLRDILKNRLIDLSIQKGYLNLERKDGSRTIIGKYDINKWNELVIKYDYTTGYCIFKCNNEDLGTYELQINQNQIPYKIGFQGGRSNQKSTPYKNITVYIDNIEFTSKEETISPN